MGAPTNLRHIEILKRDKRRWADKYFVGSTGEVESLIGNGQKLEDNFYFYLDGEILTDPNVELMKYKVYRGLKEEDIQNIVFAYTARKFLLENKDKWKAYKDERYKLGFYPSYFDFMEEYR